MRIVKYMAWEKPFLERIHAIRSMELKYIRLLLIFRSGMTAIAMSLPILAAILSFITYSLTSHSLEAAKIFTVITLFNLMRMPLMMWPMTLSSTADALNALGRLEAVFDAELVKEEKKVDPSMDVAIRLENASFTWDSAPIEEDNMMSKLTGKYAKVLNGGKPGGPPGKKEKKNKPKKATAAEEIQAGTAAGQPGAGEASAEGQGQKNPSAPGIDEEISEKKEVEIFQLRDINLNIPKGSLTAIVGAIGSGKSSLLQGLMGGKYSCHKAYLCGS